MHCRCWQASARTREEELIKRAAGVAQGVSDKLVGAEQWEQWSHPEDEEYELMQQVQRSTCPRTSFAALCSRGSALPGCHAGTAGRGALGGPQSAPREGPPTSARLFRASARAADTADARLQARAWPVAEVARCRVLGEPAASTPPSGLLP